jgi:C-terminal processing protease CtpA/Prc
MLKTLSITLLLSLLLPAAGLAANTARNFGGVGIDGVPWADGRIVVKQLVLGGPAQQAGMQVGDIITHIDGKPTRGSDFKQMVEFRLRGRAGTKVQLNVQRPGQDKPLVFILTRKQLVIDTKKKEPSP